MNIFNHFRDIVVRTLAALAAEGAVPAGLDSGRITVEPPRDPDHGDLATNAALVLAKPAAMRPRDLAERIAAHIGAHPGVAEVSIAGAGFINLRLTDTFWRERLGDILAAGADYGIVDLGAGRKVNVEYVSANPTGPLHVGHSRGAVFGDALANLLAKVGFDVTREYYVNDAGAQVEALARSTYLRYREALGEEIGEIPSGLYPGEYLVAVGQALARRDGSRWLDRPESEWLPPVRDFALDAMLAEIRDDLAALAVRHDCFSSERELVAAGKVDHALSVLEDMGLIYTGVLEPPKGKPPPEDWEPRPQTLFRATRFGDDVDRPLRKADGSWTYFAADVAYHLDKFERGFADMINVWGADHGGYVRRMNAAVAALTREQGSLDVKICQLVNLLDRGEPVKMSKRAGTFVTLREVVDEVGKDVVRFMMLTRRNDAPLDFDLAKVTEQSRDNPVFYVQYAHARIRSVMRNAEALLGAGFVADAVASGRDYAGLTHPAELALIKSLTAWPRQVESAAGAHEPHRLAFYLYELASAFHGLWNLGKEDPGLRFLIPEDSGVTRDRLALIEGVRAVIASGLAVFAVTPVEEMR